MVVMTKQNASDFFDAAADLLTPEGAWTQKAYGLDEDGAYVLSIYEVSPTSPCHCIMGAIAHVAGAHWMWDYAEVLVPVINVGTPCDIADWNDAESRTQSEVVAALRAAATSARQGESHVR